ncbi:hypothetical protein F4561_006256 [Lipingzhangella halophila]|uniref:DUF2000 domain-containing protein n=1 Tax=Lipingzhangella halophila TaxID=1783352 RepID=A0A7W7RP87_9ACTN|nr:DUF2000 domain-containing protein [Lipingzhangella halophila]MBB4935362.1 hypothetical protein [Lipingzhangella halophila]
MHEELTRPAPFALADEDIRIDQPTRKNRVRWVMVIDHDLAPGIAANAASCMAAAVGKEVPDIVGPSGQDASGTSHPGLPWTGCTVLGADAATIQNVRSASLSRNGVLLVDMPRVAAQVRVYAGYLDVLAESEPDDIEYLGVSLVGPRNAIGKLVGRLPLLR